MACGGCKLTCGAHLVEHGQGANLSHPFPELSVTRNVEIAVIGRDRVEMHEAVASHSLGHPMVGPGEHFGGEEIARA
jgi:hypothetical protein